jgi:tetratricopeptide (TPR) repeat protein
MNKLFLFFLLFCTVAHAQQNILDREITTELTHKSMQHLYNLEVEESLRYAEKLKALLPDHPAYPLIQALNIRWSEAPLDVKSEKFQVLQNYLFQALEASEKMLKKDENNAEAQFLALASHGLLAMFYAEEGSYMKAASEAKDAYGYLKDGMDRTKEYPDFYFSTGLYNYYREAYPELHPVYKPFIWFFKKGDKQQGLQQLQKARESSIFMQAEAGLYLQHIYLRYELNPQAAIPVSKDLIDKYPKNLIFRSDYVEALLEAGRYQEAEKALPPLLNSARPHFAMVGQIFKGVLLEKYYGQSEQASALYQQALQTGANCDSERAKDVKSIAYTGMGRIAQKQGDNKMANNNFKTAISLSQYGNTQGPPKSLTP